MCRGVDAEQGQAAGQHRPGGFGEREPGTVGGRGFLVPQREHRVLEGEQRVGDGDEVPREPVGCAVARRGGEGVGVGVEGVEKSAGIARAVPGYGGEPECGGVAAEGPAAGVRVTDPEEGVALPLAQQEVPRGAADAGVVVGGGVQERPAGGVAAEGVGSWPAGTGRRLTSRGAVAPGAP